MLLRLAQSLSSQPKSVMSFFSFRLLRHFSIFSHLERNEALRSSDEEKNTSNSSAAIIDTPNTVKNSKIQDNDSNLAILQQIIDIKQEIDRYQDSIAVISAKKIVSFSGKNTTKITWKTEEETLLHYQKKKT